MKIILSAMAALFAGSSFAVQMANQTWTLNRIGESEASIISNVTERIGQVEASIPTDNSQLGNGSGYVTETITNGLISASYIATNNPAFVQAVTNCPVVIAHVDGSTLGEFGEYGTLGALLAALAAAITWLKTNKANSADVTSALALKADLSSLPYALVDATVETTPYLPDSAFPITYFSNVRQEYVTCTGMTDGMTFLDNGNGWEMDIYNDIVATFLPDGTFQGIGADAENLLFNGQSTATLLVSNTAPLTDRAINAVSLTADATLVFPAQMAGKARDFVVRLTLVETNNVVTSVTFPADVAYETEGGEWPDLTEAGTYIVRLTEVPTASELETARFFLQCSSVVADATPPSAGGES